MKPVRRMAPQEVGHRIGHLLRDGAQRRFTGVSWHMNGRHRLCEVTAELEARAEHRDDRRPGHLREADRTLGHLRLSVEEPQELMAGSV